MNRVMIERGEFTMKLHPKIIRELEKKAKALGIGVQELLRVRVVPDWLWGSALVSNDTIERLIKEGYIKNGRAKKHG